MRRGDLLVGALPGDYHKPRRRWSPADDFRGLACVTCALSSERHDWPTIRVTVEPTEANGLRAASQIMIDKAATIPRAKVGRAFGRLDKDAMRGVNRALLAFLGLNG